MSHGFKPGDVAMVKVDNGRERVMVRGTFNHSWVDQVGKFEDDLVKSARPLVVIDPEDRVQVALLWEEYARSTGGVDNMQAALRGLLAPPKPDEPTGLGAVIEDVEGHIHTRARNHLRPWVGLDGIWRPYADIAAVRILSEGVQP